MRHTECLLRGNLSIKEIAAAVGYGRVSSFDRDFRRTYGCSPSSWRQTHARAGSPIEPGRI
jgi:AraC-like DNA-binding protein